ncbi:hypothetical protein MKY41_11600 [Sporosarcina sp. FSL W7-1349]|uniref:hypothetical protein n=1 Tax=Sporosarcina sp. FSL W7-1349 TaxID=2921561 RepID=UPI0030F62015
MTLHQLSCDKGHECYLDLKLPENMMVVVNLLKRMTCPVCRSEELSFHPQGIEVAE